MRIGNSSRYTMLQYQQNRAKQGLDGVLAQMNGLKIQYGYQDPTIFNKTLALDFNISTLEQSKEVANYASSFTSNTDAALKELSESMTNFKSKLVQGANDIHSETSRLAIAKDLKAIRDHFLSIANTSIGGEYIFGGTATTKQPFNADGSYNGNSAALNAFLGSNNLLAYNITGSELFFGSDRDTNRVISTNIPKYNQSKLHPEIMDPQHQTGVSEKVFLKASDTLRDLLGDNDSDTSNDLKETFYITGRRPDGRGFKVKFNMEVGYTDRNQATKVQDLLDRIGREFGNTEASKVVDVTLNQWGQIEIKDLTSGRSNIEFHMISSSATQQNFAIGVEDTDSLISSGHKVTTYIQSPYLGGFSSNAITAIGDNYDHRIHTIPTTFRTHTNEIPKAPTDTLLRDIFPEEVASIELSGTRANTAPDTAGTAINPPVTFTITATSTLQDLMDFIKTTYEGTGNIKGNISVEYSDGKINIIDQNVSKKAPADRDNRDLPYTGASSLSVTLTTKRAAVGNNPAQNTNGFRNDYSVEFDKAFFSRKGAMLTSNTPQVVRSTNAYATMETKLSEVAGASLVPRAGLDAYNYAFEVKDVNGTYIRGRVDFRSGGSYMIIESPATINGVQVATPNAGANPAIRVPILQANGNPPQVSGNLTPADDITYQQLTDVLGMILNLSNTSAADLGNIFAQNANFNDAATRASYEKMLSDAKGNVQFSFDANGKLQIKDLNNTPTKMEFAFHDSQSGRFIGNPLGRIDDNRPVLTFQANGAVVADDPHINFFQQIDKMIEALEIGSYRPGGTSVYDETMRNPGVQNALLVFDHLFDHVNKVHTKNGSQGNAFQYSIKRSEALIVQAKTLRSETIDTDFPEAYLQFSTLSMGYQAMLSTIGKVSQLSLVNYL